MATKITQTLSEQRNSSQMKAFKRKVEVLLKLATPEIEYYMVRDLAKKINLPFYKATKGRGTRKVMTSNEIVKKYCKLCIEHYKKYSDDAFIDELFKHLSCQQNQHLRKLSPRSEGQKLKRKSITSIGKNDVWEHPIPLKYTRNVLIGYIKKGNAYLPKINEYIDFISEHTWQVFLVKKWNIELNSRGLKDTMPAGWDWENSLNSDVFQRYIEAGIPEGEYRK